MSDFFTKYHLEGPWPFPAVIHHFTAPDRGDPHDHPWSFRSFVLKGGYRERVFYHRGFTQEKTRRPGDSFIIESGHIHKIEELLDGDCWTLIMPLGPSERKSGFYQFREEGSYHRFWDEAEFRRMPRT